MLTLSSNACNYILNHISYVLTLMIYTTTHPILGSSSPHVKEGEI